jgi:hypothetical protein
MVTYMKRQFEFNNYGHKAVGSGRQWAVIGEI